jgi:hypothetical protein
MPISATGIEDLAIPDRIEHLPEMAKEQISAFANQLGIPKEELYFSLSTKTTNPLEARALLEQARVSAPDNIPLLNRIAGQQLKLGLRSDALETITELADRTGDPRAKVRKGMMLMEEDQKALGINSILEGISGIGRGDKEFSAAQKILEENLGADVAKTVPAFSIPDYDAHVKSIILEIDQFSTARGAFHVAALEAGYKLNYSPARLITATLPEIKEYLTKFFYNLFETIEKISPEVATKFGTNFMATAQSIVEGLPMEEYKRAFKNGQGLTVTLQLVSEIEEQYERDMQKDISRRYIADDDVEKRAIAQAYLEYRNKPSDTDMVTSTARNIVRRIANDMNYTISDKN